MTATAFDRIAPSYSDLWSTTPAGEMQREAVWRLIVPLFPAGSRALDIGCGIGDDALALQARGVHVTAIDASSEMVRNARARGVEAVVQAAENPGGLDGPYDAILSNFGTLNCVENLAALRPFLAHLTRAGGWLAICLMSRLCAWETIWYLLRGDLTRATRRWSGEASSSLAPRVFYPTITNMRHAFEPDFTLCSWHGIGLAVPPSYVTGLSASRIRRLAELDGHIASLPLLRVLSDHRLLLFRKVMPC
ncbi:MAG TPA: methyltransferase domain-containing protein [Bryobacteraceae bacterium]|nr:methyltransferase domain-containing protein [Bryobacteraceae bacterium]